jgi:ABC-type transporter Mla maintaining outer membrane lipid asymmetry ATPase subunit MlaF
LYTVPQLIAERVLARVADPQLAPPKHCRGKCESLPLPLLGLQQHTLGTEASLKAYLEFQHVSKSFDANQVLDDVSFRVLPGETLCIMGPSGVGKSVCLRLMTGFVKPDAGRVIAAGEDITDYPEEELQRVRKKITMVFQNGALFDSLTVGENVAFPLRERGCVNEDEIYRTVDRLLDTVSIKPMRDLLPAELSTGMKRSVAIARALAAQPESILYDEPTSRLKENRCQELLRARRPAGPTRCLPQRATL